MRVIKYLQAVSSCVVLLIGLAEQDNATFRRSTCESDSDCTEWGQNSVCVNTGNNFGCTCTFKLGRHQQARCNSASSSASWTGMIITFIFVLLLLSVSSVGLVVLYYTCRKRRSSAQLRPPWQTDASPAPGTSYGPQRPAASKNGQSTSVPPPYSSTSMYNPNRPPPPPYPPPMYNPPTFQYGPQPPPPYYSYSTTERIPKPEPLPLKSNS